MDLTSLNQHSAPTPDGYDNPHVETRVAFDENNRPIYITVPAGSDRAVIHAPTPGYGHREPIVYQPTYQVVQPYTAPSAPPAYSPVRDPLVCRLLAGTVAVVGCGFALSFVLEALAAATTALGFLLGIVALLWLLASGKGGSGKGVTVNITNSNRSKHRN